MRSKEVLDKNAKQILRRILQGESLTKLQKEFGIDKGTITDYYRNLFKSDERALEIFDNILQTKKKKTSTVEIDSEKLEKYVVGYLAGKITLKQVEDKLGVHYQTFKKKMIEYISNDEVLSKKYEDKKAQRANYSDIDFKKLAIEMLEYKWSQSQVEEKYGLKSKTLSKKVAKFQDTDDDELYKACKVLSETTMCKRVLTDEENEFITSIVRKYKEKDSKER